MIAIAVTLAGAASAGPSGADGSASAATPGAFAVVGYAEAGGTMAADLRRSRSALTVVGIDGVNLTSSGGGTTAVSAEALSLQKVSRALGKGTELLIGNYDEKLGDFSPTIASRLLRSAANTRQVATALAAEVRRYGWSGITVDLEALRPGDAAGLTRFVAELKAAIGPRRSVSVCLTASPDGYPQLGYDLAGLSRHADHLVLMAYDQHGPTWSAAGPVGGMPWVTASVQRLLQGAPAAKVELGIAGYGYSWPATTGSRASVGRQYTDREARELVQKTGATATWDDVQGEWHATLPDAAQLWWSDAASYAERKALAQQLHLGGVAVWSLSSADPLR